MGTFILLCGLLLVVTAHTPEEWAQIFSNINE